MYITYECENEYVVVTYVAISNDISIFFFFNSKFAQSQKVELKLWPNNIGFNLISDVKIFSTEIFQKLNLANFMVVYYCIPQ